MARAQRICSHPSCGLTAKPGNGLCRTHAAERDAKQRRTTPTKRTRDWQNITAGARQSPNGEPHTATSAQATNAHHTQQQTSPQSTSPPSQIYSTETVH
ncbi:Hypothetical protein Cul210931_1868 [Corynebacterium ulcerans]|nr:Hypothetical protein Cul210931_1868 [Corynebacterium ulcerans]